VSPAAPGAKVFLVLFLQKKNFLLAARFWIASLRSQ
jgi:hypothetical protein